MLRGDKSWECLVYSKQHWHRPRGYLEKVHVHNTGLILDQFPCVIYAQNLMKNWLVWFLVPKGAGGRYWSWRQAINKNAQQYNATSCTADIFQL